MLIVDWRGLQTRQLSADLSDNIARHGLQTAHDDGIADQIWQGQVAEIPRDVTQVVAHRSPSDMQWSSKGATI